ncbi:unnamed protein product [Pylaiella littoralis]
MCNTHKSCLQRRTGTGPFHPQQQWKKRSARDSSSTGRPTKRVSFSKKDYVLGRAQDYDRTSFELHPLLRRRRTIRTLPKAALAPAPAPAPAFVAAAPATVGNDNPDDKQQQEGQKHANFCGTWRRSHGFNWVALLEFSGVDKASVADQAARMNSSSVVHFIDHDANSFRLVVQSDIGSIQEQHFFIGGQPRPTAAAGSTTTTTTTRPSATNAGGTLSSMRWAKNGEALELSTLDAATGNEMTVSRHLASQGTVIVQHYTARRAKTGETAEAITIFRRLVQGGGHHCCCCSTAGGPSSDSDSCSSNGSGSGSGTGPE